MMVNKKKIKKAVSDILKAVNEDVTREGLIETPRRVAEMYEELIKTEEEPPGVKTFKNTSYDEIIAKKGIEYFSLCEHHIIPFFGKAHVAYLPDEKLAGLSKIARVVKYFSRRLQLQERLTQQIGNYLYENIEPRGLTVVLEGQHLCEQMRGAEAEGTMTTSAVYGLFKEEQKAKTEALKLLTGGEKL